jgi:hypothetical protein
MDIARGIVGSTWPTGINRLRFVGFRYVSLAASASFNVATNEIGMILNITTASGYTVNANSSSASSHMFGVIFNRIVAPGSNGMSFQYALFTYN